MIKVIFNKGQGSEITTYFDDVTESFTPDVERKRFILEFTSYSLPEDTSMSDYCLNILTTYINTIHCYNEKDEILSIFNKYHVIENCFTYFSNVSGDLSNTKIQEDKKTGVLVLCTDFPQ